MAFIIVGIPLFIVRSCNEEEYITKKEESSGINIKVYMHTEKKVVTMPLEEYIKGVVAAEMPAAFEPEALKAQAVAARTYAYGRMIKKYVPKEDAHEGGDICTDSTHCQAWVSKKEAMKKWGIFSALMNWNKISKAVAETRNTIIVYDNSVVNPVFHSNSGGRTENAEEVWEGSSVPYLKSVESRGEDTNPAYKNIVEISSKDFCRKLKSQYPEIRINEKDILKDIKVLEKSEGGRVKNVKVGNITLKGTELRTLFSLKSTNFILKKEGASNIKITTYGNGHGVGMSQWGANSMAKEGRKYDEILKYYYKGVEVKTIDKSGTT